MTNLQPYNTFGIETYAHQFDTVYKPEDLVVIVKQSTEPFLILGGGSNMLIKNDVLHVVKNEIMCRQLYRTADSGTTIKFGGGEVWHDCVLWTIEQNLGGIENLSLIPGTMGAAPIQNIGAYGVELKDVFYKLEAINLKTLEVETFYNNDCGFGYRSSVFKKEFKDQYFITYVYLHFARDHKVNISYGAIEDALKVKSIDHPGIKEVSDAIIGIRQSKLPDPKVLGNSGSFFQNPIINQQAFDALGNKFPDAKYYALENNQYKIPAAWLIEQCGWKGKQIGNVGCYKNQPLVLINHGGANGEELWAHALKVQASVLEKFNIKINPEVNIIG